MHQQKLSENLIKQRTYISHYYSCVLKTNFFNRSAAEYTLNYIHAADERYEFIQILYQKESFTFLVAYARLL